MIFILISLMLLASCGGTPVPSRLSVMTDQGERPLPSDGLLPRVSRSELVTRPSLGREGVVLYARAGSSPMELEAMMVKAVVHRPDQHVVAASEGLLLVDEVVLPVTVSGAGDLPHLARLDGNRVRGDLQLTRDSGAPSTLVLTGTLASGAVRVDGDLYTLPGGPSEALVLGMRGDQVKLELGEVWLDQAYFAQVCEVEPVALGVTAAIPNLPAGTTKKFTLAPPALEEGETWTLVFPSREPSPPATTPLAPGLLTDVAEAAGIAFVHFEGPDEQLDIRPTMGPGAAWGDVDGDSLPDLYLVQGGGRVGSEIPGDRLYRNLGGGRFQDMSTAAGLDGEQGAGMGALLVDLDGDSDLDLFVANYGRDRIYANDGAGRFEDFTDASGLEPLELWSAGVCAADIEGDGDLDLYVTGYLDYDTSKMPDAPEVARYRREDPHEMLPFAFPGERNRLLLNEGGMRFRDVTEERGLLDVKGRGMQPVFWDFDRDGDPDLYVANDVSFNALFRNEGDGSFTDVSYATGLDDPRGGMGLALGDVDGDGDEDLFLTNWQLESNALYESALESPLDTRHRRSNFHDSTVRSGLGPAGIGVTSWGAVLFDLELDGDLDLFVANGYTSPDYQGTGICVGQPNHLFISDQGRRFELLEGIPALAEPLASRSAAGCDYDRDGDIDLVVTANNGRVQLLRNDAPHVGRWLGVRLVQAEGNRNGVGAEVTVRVGDRVLRRSVRAGTSYLACEPAELLFGLGEAEVAAVEVRWPWGAVTLSEATGLDRWIEVVP